MKKHNCRGLCVAGIVLFWIVSMCFAPMLRNVGDTFRLVVCLIWIQVFLMAVGYTIVLTK